MIYNAPSIYKQGGGGGGGYKDGGALVDSDFIQVENNTVSSYDNVSRDPVNFYFEVKDGEILNSIIEFTTEVNATINVYIFKNGFYYLLGNVGGNTVNAGDDYKINITGDSYAIEEVTGGNNAPVLIIGGEPYGVALFNNLGLAFTSENLNIEIGKYHCYQNDQTNRKNGYGLFYLPNSIMNVDGSLKSEFLEIIPSGWRIPTSDDWSKLWNYYDDSTKWNTLRSDSGWNNTNGTNETGLNLLPVGSCGGYISPSFNNRGDIGEYFSSTVSGNLLYMEIQQGRNSSGLRSQMFWYENVSQLFAIRLCRDI